MITETITSFKDNIKRRLTNPFLGTFTVVYIIKNWELFYGIFNFDSIATQTTKIEYIRQYFWKISVFWNLVECIGYTFFILVITYSLLAISRYIANIYNDIALPWITKLTDKSKIVLKEDYIRLYNEKEEIEKKYENERENRARIQGERDSLENNIIDLKTSDKSTAEILNLNEKINSLQSNVSKLESEKAYLQKQLIERENETSKLRNENEEKKDNLSDDNLAKMLYEEIKKRKLISALDDLFLRAGKSSFEYFPKDKEFFIENNIFKFNAEKGSSLGNIIITPLGDSIYNMRLIEKYK
jgi:hypothetical protein